jgi:TonB family protein
MLKIRISLLVTLCSALVLGSCASLKESEDNQKYRYEFQGNTYQLKIVDGAISDTSYIFDKSDTLIEKSVWTKMDSAHQINFIQTTLLEKNKTEYFPKDSSRRSTESILSVVRKATPTLRGTYNKYLKERPGFRGRVRLKIWINPNGDIRKIIILENTTKWKAFGLQILREIAMWKFEPVNDDNLDMVTVPITFDQ